MIALKEALVNKSNIKNVTLTSMKEFNEDYGSLKTGDIAIDEYKKLMLYIESKDFDKYKNFMLQWVPASFDYDNNDYDSTGYFLTFNEDSFETAPFGILPVLIAIESWWGPTHICVHSIDKKDIIKYKEKKKAYYYILELMKKKVKYEKSLSESYR